MAETRSEQDAYARPSDFTPQPATTLDQIVDALRGLQYGQVTIIVQDGVVVQIERTEKRRLK